MNDRDKEPVPVFSMIAVDNLHQSQHHQQSSPLILKLAGVTEQDARIDELIKFVDNSKRVVEQLQFLIDKHSLEEEYETCRGIKSLQKIHEAYIMRLNRILEGKPAFDKSIFGNF